MKMLIHAHTCFSLCLCIWSIKWIFDKIQIYTIYKEMTSPQGVIACDFLNSEKCWSRDFTRKSFLNFVYSHVNFSNWNGLKILTHTLDKKMVSCFYVFPTVFFKICTQGKCWSTHLTSKCFLSHMCSHVNFKIATFRKLFFIYLTWKEFLSSVMSRFKCEYSKVEI